MATHHEIPHNGADSPDRGALDVLRGSKVVESQRISWGSNYTFLVGLDHGREEPFKAVYKPRDGERPLHDFPRGSLYRREYAAYVVARALGWPLIPPTVIREGPYGIGSFQQYVEADPDATYFDLAEERRDELLPFAVFDAISNNADRKAGHCLLGEDGRIWSIDHGLTFHAVFKVRSVMLDLWGTQIPKPLILDIQRLAEELAHGSAVALELSTVLEPSEIEALQARLAALIKEAFTPKLNPYVNVPWPLV